MNKIIKLLLFLGALLSFNTNSLSASADEIEDFITKHMLIGDSLDKFEQEEQIQMSLLSDENINFEKIKKDYQEYIESGFLSEDITYEMYLELVTAEPPTDPVADEFRTYSIAGQPQAGDILITNGTTANGLTGHAGIFLGHLGNGAILSIRGFGHKPEMIGIFTWMERYGGKGNWTKLYRPTERYKPALAAEFAMYQYANTNYSYGITTNILGLDPTYCSKIVWQGYWYSSAAPQIGGLKKPLIASPYDLPDYFEESTPVHIATWQ